MKHEFGPINNNHAPVRGYDVKTLPPMRVVNPYLTEVQRSRQWVRREKTAYDEAYPDEASYLRAQQAVHEVIQTPLGNHDLPIESKVGEIGYAMTHNRATLLVGKTGSGKSTQVPQIALNNGFDFVVQTQPLRLAARTIAERISDEIVHVRPYEAPEISAFHTGEMNTSTSKTKILQVTPGTLFAEDIHRRPRAENELRIHDEIHTGGLIDDMSIALSVLLMRERPEMNIFLQSATVDIDKWKKYFRDVLDIDLAVIEVEGRTYPIEVVENYEVTSPEQAIICIQEAYRVQQEQKELVKQGYEGELRLTSGAVVCPGVGEIKEWSEAIEKGLPPEVAQKTFLVPLHSALTHKEQKRALRTDYDGVKVVMTTDTARSSVTIEDLGWLVDCGWARRIEIDDEGAQSLVLYPTSHAVRTQWIGRIGRMGPGTAYQVKMGKNIAHTPLAEARPFDEPEIRRSNIEEFILGVKALGIDIEDLPLPEHADKQVIARCRENCRTIGALDENYELTPIGRRMVDCSTSYISARMLVEADQYSPEVQAYMAAIVASHEAGDLQMFKRHGSKRWQGEEGLTTEERSDLFAQLDLFIATQDLLPYQWRQYDLSERNINLAHETYRKLIRKSQASRKRLEPPTPTQREELMNCIYAGMVDNIFVYAGTSNKKRTYTGVNRFKEPKRTISNRSVVTGNFPFVVGTPRGVQSVKDDELRYKDIIQTVTGLDDIKAIGRFATNLCEWQRDGETRWRDGRPIVTRKQVLFGQETGTRQELVATPSAETREALIQHVLKNPGPAQQKIRAVKKQLEELNHLAKDDVPQLLQSDLVALIQRAAPDDVLDPYVIDFNLQQMDISLETFHVTPEQLQEIRDNAPEYIETSEGALRLTYRSARPVVHKYDQEIISKLPDGLSIPDGREIYFVHNRREYTLAVLKRIIAAE